MTITIADLVSKYLAWCKKHRSERTWEWYSGYLNGLLDHLGDTATLDAMDLKPYHVMEWVDCHDNWGGNYIRGAIVAVQRAFSWGEEMGYIPANHLRRMKKPPATRRELYMTQEDFDKALALLRPNDPFRDLLTFVWLSGCRPQEARNIQVRHVQLDSHRIVFPAEESKGKRQQRIIYLHEVTLYMVRILVKRYGEGHLFRNYRGTPWTKFSICNRFYRLSQKMGKRMICYSARHGFATRKLLKGVGHLTIAAIMGHADGSMIAKIYSHIENDVDHLKKALED